MGTAADFWRALQRQPAEGAAVFLSLDVDTQAQIADGAIDAFLEKARDAAWRDEEQNVGQCLKHAARVAEVVPSSERWTRIFEVHASLQRYEDAIRTAKRDLAPTARLLTSLARSLSNERKRRQVDVTTLPQDVSPPRALALVLEALLALPIDDEGLEPCLFALGVAGRVEDGLRLLTRSPDLAWLLSWGLLYGGDAASIAKVASQSTEHSTTCWVHHVVALLREGRIDDAEATCAQADDRARLSFVRYYARSANLMMMSEVADGMTEPRRRVLAELEIVELALAMGETKVAGDRLALARKIASDRGHRAHAERLARAAERLDGNAKLTIDEAVAVALALLRTDGFDAALTRVRKERAGKRRVTIGYRMLRAAVDHLGMATVARLELEGTFKVLALASLADAEDEVRDYEAARERLAEAYRSLERVKSKAERAALLAKLEDLKSRLP